MPGEIELTPDEEKQLREIMENDGSRVDEFLQTYFPEQYQRRQAAQAQALEASVEGVDYAILAEDDTWVEFEVAGTKIRLEREPFQRKAGRPRENPWIDLRFVERQRDPAVKSACYAVAARKLAQEGQTMASQFERKVLSAMKGKLFKDDDGVLALLHITQVAMKVRNELEQAGVPRGVKLEAVVTRAVQTVVAGLVSKDLEG